MELQSSASLLLLCARVFLFQGLGLGFDELVSQVYSLNCLLVSGVRHLQPGDAGAGGERRRRVGARGDGAAGRARGAAADAGAAGASHAAPEHGLGLAQT